MSNEFIKGISSLSTSMTFNKSSQSMDISLVSSKTNNFSIPIVGVSLNEMVFEFSKLNSLMIEKMNGLESYV